MQVVLRSRTLLAALTAMILAIALALPAAADLSLVPGDSAEVAYTQGDGVNVRDLPGFAGSILLTLPEGARVSIVDGPLTIDDGTAWYQVRVDWDGASFDGWIIADYLADNTPTATTSETELGSSYSAVVTGTDGYGLRLREAATIDAATITVMPEGSSVTVLATDIYDTAGASWYHVDFDGVSGYSAAGFLVADAAGAAETDTATETASDDETSVADASVSTDISEPATATLAAGDLAQVVGTNGAGLNQRYEPNYAAGVVALIPEGATATVLDGPVWDADGNGWYQLDYAGSLGWGHGGYLVWAGGDVVDLPTQPAVGAEIVPAAPDSTPPVDTPGSGGSADDTTTPSAPIAGVGDAIVAEAMNYVGVPYVWGGTTPAGFDCSGFTWYVVNEVAGTGLSRDLTVQVVTGTFVAADYLAPGDLVFFQNTYQWGLSHVGIYIGGGQFVHAGSERTGVTVTNLWDDYWGPRYLTARRVA
jgi:cell wall-associated NlpC family hydrolase